MIKYILNDKKVVLLGVASVLCLLLSYFIMYMFIPCFIFTIIDLFLLRSKIDKMLKEFSYEKLLSCLRNSIFFLVISLVSVVALLIFAYTLDNEMVQLILTGVAGIMLVINISVTYYVSAVQLNIKNK